MGFLELFRRAQAAADDLQRCNDRISELRETLALHGHSGGPHVSGGFVHDVMAPVDALLDKELSMRERAASECECWIDAAWDAVELVSTDWSDAAAQALTMHYLMGETWDSVAASLNRRSRTTVWELVCAAIDWLDSVAVVDMDKDGAPHVRALAG